MTGTEIIAMATPLAAIGTIDAAEGRGHINNAKNILATYYDSACMIETIEIEAEAGIWASLPDNALRTNIVYYDNGTQYNNEFYVDNLRIKFPISETFTVEYFCEGADMVANTEEPNIRSIYHKCMAYFVAAMQCRYKHEERYNRLYNEFLERAQAIDMRFKRGKRKNKLINV